MLINCAFSERVAPLMLIFRVIEQGWSRERAIEEAGQSGLKAEALKKFADEYFKTSKKKTALRGRSLTV
jgi:hypothetical protein